METHRWRHRDFYVQSELSGSGSPRLWTPGPAGFAACTGQRRGSMWSSNHCSAVRRNAIASPCALCRRAVSACCIGSLEISIDSSTLRSESRRALSLATVTVPLLEPEQPRDEGARRYVRREVGLGVGLQPTRLDRRASISGLYFGYSMGCMSGCFLSRSIASTAFFASSSESSASCVVPEEFLEAALEVLSPPAGKRGDRLADAGAHEREDEVDEKEAERNVECRKVHGSRGRCYCQSFAEGVLVFAHP